VSEIDLIQASATWATLAYTTSQWWVTVTTALVLATYFAAKHIAPWFLGVIFVLYVLTAISVIFELSEYSEVSLSYGIQMTQMRVAHHEIGTSADANFILRLINNYINYAIIAIGTFAAIAFSFIHWRKERPV
jgi:MFS superfamily sulfate permease-like transporter